MGYPHRVLQIVSSVGSDRVAASRASPGPFPIETPPSGALYLQLLFLALIRWGSEWFVGLARLAPVVNGFGTGPTLSDNVEKQPELFFKALGLDGLRVRFASDATPPG